MKKTLSLLITLTLAFQAQAFECQAEKRDSSNNRLEVKTVTLKPTDSYGDGEKFIADIDEAFFSVQLNGNDHVSMITIGPNYTTGNLAKGGLNDAGELKLSYVTPLITYILNCK